MWVILTPRIEALPVSRETSGAYRQAGRLLAQLHGQLTIEDPTYETRARDKALQWLGSAHRITPAATAALRTEVESWPTPPADVVPTHGDWQPRNWLTDQGTIKVIDFGRAALRPASTDLARLSAQQFRAAPGLEAAFFEGYGHDPREPGSWYRERLREAIGATVWAFQVGDRAFEEQGHRMLAEVMARD